MPSVTDPNSAIPRWLCLTVSPPSETLAKSADHDWDLPRPAPHDASPGFMSASLMPALCAAGSDTTVRAPVSNSAVTSSPLTWTLARIAGWPSRVGSGSRSSSETGVSPAQ